MTDINNLSVNAIRVLAADEVQKANSGHPGLPLGCAPVAYELWGKHMNHNPKILNGLIVTVSFIRWTWFFYALCSFTFIWLWFNCRRS